MNLFPCLCELLTLHRNFILSLVTAQRNSLDRSIENIGFILCSQVQSLDYLFPSFHPFIQPSIHPSIYQSICSSTHPFIRVSAHNAWKACTIHHLTLHSSAHPLTMHPSIHHLNTFIFANLKCQSFKRT